MKKGNISDNFNRNEFRCQCGCGFDTIDAELIRVLEDLRAKLRGPRIIVTSGCRCAKHNKDVGGSPASMHVKGKAADFVVEGVQADTVADCLEDVYPDRYGIGRYPGRTHVDVREGVARWDKR